MFSAGVFNSLVAYIYSECDRFSTVMGKDIDTSDFDTLFFKHGSEEAIGIAMFDIPFATGEIAHPKANSTTEDESFLNERLGKLTSKDRLIMHGYFGAFARSRVAGRNFIYEHREEIEPIIERAKRNKTGGEE